MRAANFPIRPCPRRQPIPKYKKKRDENNLGEENEERTVRTEARTEAREVEQLPHSRNRSASFISPPPHFPLMLSSPHPRERRGRGNVKRMEINGRSSSSSVLWPRNPAAPVWMQEEEKI